MDRSPKRYSMAELQQSYRVSNTAPCQIKKPRYLFDSGVFCFRRDVTADARRFPNSAPSRPQKTRTRRVCRIRCQFRNGSGTTRCLKSSCLTMAAAIERQLADSSALRVPIAAVRKSPNETFSTSSGLVLIISCHLDTESSASGKAAVVSNVEFITSYLIKVTVIASRLLICSVPRQLPTKRNPALSRVQATSKQHPHVASIHDLTH
jgi:hypothetical protein